MMNMVKKMTKRKRPRRGTPIVPAKAKELIEADKPLFEIRGGLRGYPSGRAGRTPRVLHCFICEMDSHSPQDIAHKFCGNCKVFFEDVRQAHAVLAHVQKGKDDSDG